MSSTLASFCAVLMIFNESKCCILESHFKLRCWFVHGGFGEMTSCGCMLALLGAQLKRNILTVHGAIKVWIWNVNHKLLPSMWSYFKGCDPFNMWGLAGRQRSLGKPLKVSPDPGSASVSPVSCSTTVGEPLQHMAIIMMGWNLSEIRSQVKHFFY